MTVVRARRIATAILAVIVLVAGVAAIVFSRGTFQTYPRTLLLRADQQRRAPAWTRPCWSSAKYIDKIVCERVTGRVVWIQKHDPDGDGDRHLIVIARLHPRIVKLSIQLPVKTLPRIGSWIDATGWMMRGGTGHMELDTVRLTWSGRLATTNLGH
ncbi:MAG TPA: hypothetical protein VI318_06940 [Baekduia sp.]